MTLIQLVVLLAVIGLGLWALSKLPIDAQIMQIIRVVVIVVVVLWLLELVGLLPSTPIPKLHSW